MAPEQAHNAANVDHRADIYSLGCTFYVLLRGRVPFKGKTAMEVLLKHVKNQPEPLERYVRRMPKEVSTIVQKMMAKKPEDRFPDMGAVIDALEKFLGVTRIGPFSPSEEHADTLEHCVKFFNNAPSAKLRSRLIPGFYAGCALLMILASFFSLRLGLSFFGLAAMTALFMFLVRGLTVKPYLFLKVREFVFGSGWSDWLTWGACLLLLLALLFMTGLLKFWLAFLVVAGSMAVVIRILIDRPLEKQRQPAIVKAEQLLRSLRLKGLPEDSLRQFVCHYSGQHWEEFYETLFGYESLVAARKLWSRPEGGKPRPTFGAWRDPIVQWIDARQRARKEAREQRLLEQIERKKLQAEGVGAEKAQAQAAQAAAVMVHAAVEIKQESQRRAAPEIPVAQVVEATAIPVAVPAPPPLKAAELIQVAEEPRALTPEEKKQLQAAPKVPLTTVLFGPKPRFLLGTLLIVLCFLWMNHNELIPDGEVRFDDYLARLSLAQPLSFLPGVVGDVFNSLNPGVAGLLLVLSALTRSRNLLFFLVLAVLVLLIGPVTGVPDLLNVDRRHVCLLAGLLLAEFGYIFNHAARQKA
jgi:hypothetical protein